MACDLDFVRVVPASGCRVADGQKKGEFVDGQTIGQPTGEFVDGQTIIGQPTGEFVDGQTIVLPRNP